MLVALIFYMFAGFSPLYVGLIFVLAITTQIFSIDEKSTAQVLLSSLPLTRKEIVSSKYISAVIYIVMITGLLNIGNYFIHQELPNWSYVGLIVIISLMLVSLIYPFSYKFSSKYLMITFISGFAIYFFVMNLFIPNINDQLRALISEIIAVMEVELMLITLMIGIVLYGFSWILSIKIYEKKAF